MGSEASSEENHTVQQRQQWSKEASFGLYELVKNNQGILGESHQLEAVDTQRQMAIYQMRYENPQFIVTVYQAVKCSEKFLCAINQRIEVITQRIPYRLNDLGNIAYSEGIYILDRILKAAKIIQDKYLKKVIRGNFINNIVYKQEMVCFTQEGKMKLWVNEDISSNSYHLTENEHPVEESELVMNIMNLIETKMSGNKFIKYMKQKLKFEQRGQLKTFDQAIEFMGMMRAGDKQATGEQVNCVILPNMVLNSLSSSTKQSTHLLKDQSENISSVYGSKIRKSIQQAQKSHDFSKLQKPPLSRKSSKSKQSSNQKQFRRLTPSKKPIQRQKSPQIINYNQPTSNPSHSYPSPSLQINPLNRKLSKSAVNEREESNKNPFSKTLSVTSDVQKRLISPFREIQREASLKKSEKPIAKSGSSSHLEYTEKKQLYPSEKPQTNKLEPIKPLEIRKQSFKGNNLQPLPQRVHIGSLSSSDSQKNFPTTNIRINGHTYKTEQPTIKFGIPANSTAPPRKYEAPQLTFKSNTPKINFTFGSPKPSIDIKQEKIN